MTQIWGGGWVRVGGWGGGRGKRLTEEEEVSVVVETDAVVHPG